MSYYGADIDIADTESAYDDPTDELEANAEADDPEGDLGDGRARRRVRSISDLPPSVREELIRRRGF